MGEHKFDRARNRLLGVGKWEKAEVLAFLKVAVTGNTEKKKSNGRWYRLCKIPQHAEG